MIHGEEEWTCAAFTRSVFCFAGKFITVGWGKKETQFHGSEGKQAAQKKIQVAVQLQKRVSAVKHKCVRND